MIQQILDYKNVLVQIEGMIAESPYKKGFIIDKVGIPAPTFYRKLKTLSFTPDEVLSIAKLLNPREAILMEIEASEKEIDNGDFIEHSKLTAELRKEFL